MHVNPVFGDVPWYTADDGAVIGDVLIPLHRLRTGQVVREWFTLVILQEGGEEARDERQPGDGAGGGGGGVSGGGGGGGMGVAGGDRENILTYPIALQHQQHQQQPGSMGVMGVMGGRGLRGGIDQGRGQVFLTLRLDDESTTRTWGGATSTDVSVTAPGGKGMLGPAAALRNIAASAPSTLPTPSSASSSSASSSSASSSSAFAVATDRAWCHPPSFFSRSIKLTGGKAQNAVNLEVRQFVSENAANLLHLRVLALHVGKLDVSITEAFIAGLIAW